jgi:hypothetical protein
MFGKSKPQSRKQREPMSQYEIRMQERQAEYARLGLTTYAEQQTHEFRKVALGSDYHERDSGTWKQAEDFMKKSGHTTWWDRLWN